MLGEGGLAVTGEIPAARRADESTEEREEPLGRAGPLCGSDLS